MSFAYKKLNPSDIKSVPYVANKQYEFDSSSYLDNNIQTYIGEYIPITTAQPFDPVNDNLTTDGNYRRLIYESIRHLYYQNYVTKSSLDQATESEDLIYPKNVGQFWHSSSYDNFLQNTMVSGSFVQNYRSFPYFESIEYNFDNVSSSLYGTAIYFIENAAKIRVISIPKDKYGTGISPYTFELSGSNFLIKDDGEGNLFDYALTEARYSGTPYVDPNNRYAGPNLEVPVGNVFYNHGIAVITNVDYICFIETAPVARNTYIDLLNTQETKTIPTLLGDFDDCTSLDTSSVLTFTSPGYEFPDYSVSASGDLIITPNNTSVVPGEYKLFYSVENTEGLVSNTGSILLNLTTQPLISEILSLTQSCYQGNLSSSVTFSIDQGVPPYSYSIDNINYTPSNDLFQPIISASLLPSRSLILYVKDNEDAIVTQSIDTAFTPIDGRLWQNDVSFCGTNDGYIIASASGDLPITASLSASFNGGVELPNTMSSLEVGTYTVYFKDANNCTTTSQIEITKTIPITASYEITHIDCFGSSTGKIILDELDENGEFQDYFLTGGTEPLTWSWAGPNGFSTNSQDIENVPSGSYTLNIFDGDGCNYVFNYDITSSTQITYTASIAYSSSEFPQLEINNITGGTGIYNISINTLLTQYTSSLGEGDSLFNLTGESLNSGSASIQISDSILGCVLPTQSFEIYGRTWELTSSFCEDGTGSIAQRNLNFYTNEPTGAEWVTVLISSGSETPIQLDTSGSATGSYSWNSNSTLYIDIYTGSNDDFYLRREFSGSNANVTGSEVTSSAIILGNANMIHFEENLDVSLAFGPDYNIGSLHLTASKVNTEDETTDINFKFDRQIPLSKIRDNFTASAATLITTGSDGSGSNFIARNDQFTDIEYGNTGSFIGQNKLLFRDTYAFGNILNTISGSSVEYTSGSIFSGSVSASIFGGENAYYFTQRTDKAWLMVADVDNIEFLEAYSYTDASEYANDPIGVRTNTTYTHREYKIFAASQRMENDLMYITIIHEDEYAEMPLPAGLGGGEIFSRKLQNLKDVNRVYYLFMSPIGSSDSQADLDSRAISIGQYFIDNVIYG
jgi:hypothetical protein